MPKTEEQLLDEYFKKFGDEIIAHGDEEDIKEYNQWLKKSGLESIVDKKGYWKDDTGPLNKF